MVGSFVLVVWFLGVALVGGALRIGLCCGICIGLLWYCGICVFCLV